MGLLGTVFEALFIPDEGTIPTIRATATERRDESATAATASALLADVDDSEVPRIVRAMILPARLWGAFKFRGKTDAPPGPVAESRLDIWFDPPRRARIDRTWTNNGAAEHLVCLAEEFRTQTGAKRERTYDATRRRWLGRPAGSAPSDNDVVRHFWPSHLREIVTGLSFAEPREATIAGRQVARVHATQRAGGGLWPHWLIWGADEFDLAFDLEYGHLLLVEGYRDGISSVPSRSRASPTATSSKMRPSPSADGLTPGVCRSGWWRERSVRRFGRHADQLLAVGIDGPAAAGWQACARADKRHLGAWLVTTSRRETPRPGTS